MLIKHGTTRMVVLIGRLAFKLPSMVEWRLFLLGLLANMQENLWWKNLHDLKLCPVVFSLPGGALVVMRRAEPLDQNLFFSLDVSEWRQSRDYNIPVEEKLDSFGVLDGRIVAVDYGN